MSGEMESLKSEIRAHVESELGEAVTVEFVEDVGRIDVRITDLGIVDELEGAHDDVSVTVYSDYRLTIQYD